MSPAAKPQESRKRRPEGGILYAWQQADQQVPFPTLYRALAQPSAGQTAAPLRALNRFEFVYRVTESFVARFAGDLGNFQTPALVRESFNFRLMPIAGSQGLISPEDAERCVEHYLKANPVPFWSGAGAGEPPKARRGGDRGYLRWRSLLIEQPFRAGIIEPFYIFQSESGFHEFCVGARTETVQLRLTKARLAVA